ncbi:MAG: LysR family transcriptional regulator [Comamonas sp.]
MDRALEMTVFVTVVEAGSFVGAVEPLRLSKPAVSRHVNALEQRLGVRLLQRTTRRLSLTDEGRTFYRRAKEVLAQLDEAEAEVKPSGEPTGTLRVNVPVSFGIRHLAPLWGAFMQRYPRVTLEITLNDRVIDLLEEGYDLTVRISALASSSLISRRLATTRMLLCAAPGYLREHGTPAHPHDLVAHRLLSYSNWSGRDEWRFEHTSGPVSTRVRPAVLSNNGDTTRMLAIQGHGISLEPSFMVADDLARGDLVEVLPAYRALTLGIYAVYPSRQHLPLRTRCLIDYLVQALGTPAWEQPIAA